MNRFRFASENIQFGKLMNRFSVCPIIAPMPWDRSDIKPRVTARLAELGKTLDDVLPGNSFFAPRDKDKSVRIDTLERLATGIGWSLCQLLCEIEPEPVPASFGTERIKLAVSVAVRAIRPERAEKIPDATVSALDLLQAYEREGRTLDRANLDHIELSIRAQYKDL
jgi:hypothetical protein